MDLVDLAAELRDRGMTIAEIANELVQPEWSTRAFDALVKLARENATVHIDQFLQAFPERPSHPNAAGGIWRKAIKEHIIIHSGRVKPCTADPQKHLHQYAVYLSLLYRRTP